MFSQTSLIQQDEVKQGREQKTRQPLRRVRTGPGHKTAPKESNIRALELSKTFHLCLERKFECYKGN